MRKVKNMKTLTLLAIIAMLSTGTIIISSCTKTSCSGVVCENGGQCSDGDCSCPTGYTGLFCQIKAKTAIKYQNNTFTPVTLSVNGDTKVLPVGGTATFTGGFGDVANGNAITSGSASSLGTDNSGGIIGLEINWGISNVFPNEDTLLVPLEIGSTYFFLKMMNSGSADIINFYVNTDFPYGQVYQNITIPNDGVTYGLGYYLAYPSSNVQVQTNTSQVTWQSVTLPFTSNQSYTAEF